MGAYMSKGLHDISQVNHEKYMDIAINEAVLAAQRGDMPITAVLVHKNVVIGKASNSRNTRKSKIHHAENWLCLEHAQYLMEYGPECILYTTLEPCIMCLSTLIMADVRNFVIGYPDRFMETKKYADLMPWLRDRIFNYIVGIRHDECKDLIIQYGDEKSKQIVL
jgi:tRNA(Arg) A34 adenosine deaminase TadA